MKKGLILKKKSVRTTSLWTAIMTRKQRPLLFKSQWVTNAVLQERCSVERSCCKNLWKTHPSRITKIIETIVTMPRQSKVCMETEMVILKTTRREWTMVMRCSSLMAKSRALVISKNRIRCTSLQLFKNSSKVVKTLNAPSKKLIHTTSVLKNCRPQQVP